MYFRNGSTTFQDTKIYILKKYPDVVSEQAPLIILNSKSAIYMSQNGKNTKHTRYIASRMNLVINGEEWNFHKTVRCEGGLQLAGIVTKNIREDALNTILGYDMVRLENWQNTCQRGVTGHRRVWGNMFSECLDCIKLRIRFNEFEMFIWIHNENL